MDQDFPVDEAVACYCAGWSEDDIARLFKIDAKAVRDRIVKARKDGMLVPKRQTKKSVSFDNSLTAFLEREISETLGYELKLVIVPSHDVMFEEYITSEDPRKDKFDAYRKAEKQAIILAAGYAAQFLREMLLDGHEHVIGLNWGNAVKAVIESMSSLPPRSHSRIKLVSLFGDLAFGSPNEKDENWEPANTNCNSLVSELALRIGQPIEEIHLAVPGFIPTTFGDESNVLNGIKDFLCGHSSYKRIFGDSHSYIGKDTGEIDRVDTILTGFGSADDFTLSHGRLAYWLKDEDKKILKECQANLAGDLGGHYEVEMESVGASDKCKKFADKLSDRVLAAQPGHFKAVADKYRQHGFGAGVLGVAAGARKARMLRTLLCMQPSVPINGLFIDSHCALALLSKLKGGDKEWHKKLEKQLPEFWNSKNHWSYDTNKMLGLTT